MPTAVLDPILDAPDVTSRSRIRAVACFDARVAPGAGARPGGVAFAEASVFEGNHLLEDRGMYADDETLAGLASLLQGKSVPAYITHEGAIFGDRLTHEVGMWSGFYRDGDKVRAKNFSFFRSFENYEPAKRDKLLELAERMPDKFGLSMVVAQRLAWATPDGDVPFSRMEPRPADALYEAPSLRFVEVESIDFVKTPAANRDGLFGAQAPLVDALAEGMAPDQPTPQTPPAPTEAPEAAPTPEPGEDALLAAFREDVRRRIETLEAERDTFRSERDALATRITGLETQHAETRAALAAEQEAVSRAAAALATTKTQLAQAQLLSADRLGIPPVETLTGSTGALVPEQLSQQEHAQVFEAMPAGKARSDYYRRFIRPFLTPGA